MISSSQPAIRTAQNMLELTAGNQQNNSYAESPPTASKGQFPQALVLWSNLLCVFIHVQHLEPSCCTQLSLHTGHYVTSCLSDLSTVHPGSTSQEDSEGFSSNREQMCTLTQG